MKRLFFPVLLSILFMISCRSKKSPAEEMEAAKNNLIKTSDSIYSAYTNGDLNTFFSFLSDDGLYCGTDPEEFWDKASYRETITKMFSDSSFHPDILIDRREVHFENGGKSAIVVDQFYTGWSKKIPVRHVNHFIKRGSKWIYDFSSMALIPGNKDLNRINNSLE